MTNAAVSINENKLFIALIVFELILFTVFLADRLLLPGIDIDVLNLDYESTIGTWFSTLQYFFIALIFLHKYQLVKSSSPSSSLFLVAAIGFMFLSIDESISFHEKINYILRNVDFLPSFKGNNGIWIYLYLALLMPLIAMMHRPLANAWKDYQKSSIIMLIGALTLVFGAVVLEVIGYEFLNFDINDKYYVLEVAFEEFFEMAGVSIMLYGALTLLRTQPNMANDQQTTLTWAQT